MLLEARLLVANMPATGPVCDLLRVEGPRQHDYPSRTIPMPPSCHA